MKRDHNGLQKKEEKKKKKNTKKTTQQKKPHPEQHTRKTTR